MKKPSVLRKIPANRNRKTPEDYQREYEDLAEQMKALRARLIRVNREWANAGLAQRTKAAAGIPPHDGTHGWHEVEDFPLFAPSGKKVRLSDLFQGKDELIVIQNMGRSCPYCTLWADGFNGVWEHLENRAGFALVSPDRTADLKKFAASRGWKFKTYSSHGSDFKKHLGFQDMKGNPKPGVSTFYRERGRIYNIANDTFGPGDLYCGVWPLLDLLKNGPNGWSPKYKYRK